MCEKMCVVHPRRVTTKPPNPGGRHALCQCPHLPFSGNWNECEERKCDERKKRLRVSPMATETHSTKSHPSRKCVLSGLKKFLLVALTRFGVLCFAFTRCGGNLGCVFL